MKKLGDLFRCNPLACLSAFSLIVVILFGWIKADVSQIRTEITGIYALMIGKPSKTALLGPLDPPVPFPAQSADR